MLNNPYICSTELELNDGTMARCDVEYDIEDCSITLGRIFLSGTNVEISEEEFSDDRFLYGIIENHIDYLEDQAEQDY